MCPPFKKNAPRFGIGDASSVGSAGGGDGTTVSGAKAAKNGEEGDVEQNTTASCRQHKSSGGIRMS